MYYCHYDNNITKIFVLMFGPVVFATVVPDEDGQRSSYDEGQDIKYIIRIIYIIAIMTILFPKYLF